VLTGSDVAGSWKRPVSYWMPFLHNKHGIYGFHDATWRPDSEFGNVSPASPDASHGCVELPLASQAWLYKWAPVGTTVKIKD
ncbi:MAG TPA: L,D-transpeptidase, partial [Candidatus Saccharimonadales bacterium]|nr:L,D-transpeptidase [Candidatus Saccharimonadales bacterium]